MIQINCRFTQKVLWEGEAESVRDAVINAIKERVNLRDVNLRDVNLRDVNLRDVNLRDVNLRDADLGGIREDWIEEFAKEHEISLPTRKVIWSDEVTK